MIEFKGCPKCQGDLYLNQDIYGEYLNCLQCGYIKDVTGKPDPHRSHIMEVGQTTAAAERGRQAA